MRLLKLSLVLLLALLFAVGCDDGPAATSDTFEDALDTTNTDGSDAVPPDVIDETSPEDVVGDVVADEVSVDAGCDGQKRCSSIGDIETCMGDVWVTTDQCALGCENGVCTIPTDPGSCGDPTPLPLNTEVTGSTDTGRAYNEWNQACTNAYGFRPSGPEQVFALELTAPSTVRFTLNAGKLTYYGIYVRTHCADETTTLSHMCDGNPSEGTGFTLEGVLPKGTSYVFVDDFGTDYAGPGEFTIKAEVIPTAVCEGQVVQWLDVSSGTAIAQGDTANGNNSTTGNEFDCPQDALQSSGKELIYGFVLDRTATVRAKVDNMNPADSLVLLYLRSECEVRLSGQVACGYTQGTGAALAEAELTAGDYYVFVDDFVSSVDTTQSFRLTLSVL